MVEAIELDNGQVTCAWKSSRDELPALDRRLVQAEIPIISFRLERDDLEEIDMHTLGTPDQLGRAITMRLDYWNDPLVVSAYRIRFRGGVPAFMAATYFLCAWRWGRAALLSGRRVEIRGCRFIASR